MAPVARIALQPTQLEEMFGAGASPAPSLAFKAARDLHFDVLLNHSTAVAHRSELAPDRATQGARDLLPVVDPFAVA